jgi:hypothetical protein
MNHMHDEDEAIEEAMGTEIIQLPTSDLLADAMIDVQISTAKRYPRSISKFRKEAEALAMLDEETAGECLYALPRGTKTIEGPSVRFAEIILHAWGNVRADAEVIEEGDTHIVAQGTFFDLERNVAVRKKIKRRITDKHGTRYNDDMIGVTGNAANSIALRNAIFAGIPKAVWKGIYTRVRKASIGKEGTLTEKRAKMIEWFGEQGVEPERIFAQLGIDGVEDVKEDQLITLRGLANAIRDGELTVAESFPRPGSVNTGRNIELNEALKAKTEKNGKCRRCKAEITTDNAAEADLCLECAVKDVEEIAANMEKKLGR